MNNPFSHPRVTHNLHFITKYKFLEQFESFFPEDTLGISSSEVKSFTVDSQPNDLWSMEVYLPAEPDLKLLASELSAFAEQHDLEIESELTLKQIEDKDWVAEYQSQLKPIIAGQFFITSSSAKAACPKEKTPIFIEASRAFGTGDHATTSLCIEAMEALSDIKFKNIFDIGTGSGILSFAADKIWPGTQLLACDIEEISVKLAKENQIHNNSHIDFYQNTETDLAIPDSRVGKFDLIVSNILAKPLISMANSIRQITSQECRVILSGFLDYQENEVTNAYITEGFEVEEVLRRNSWVCLTLKVKRY
ncbi:MAG: 50S ribosomal protein L11 methyltransferase [Rickettsiales bacterium]|nr:MAG: 50S ribosomal protein L11 methyltransferase [Rickettsiales bacterium]